MENESKKPRKANDGFDELIRRSVPYVRPQDQHRETLRMLLRANVQRETAKSKRIAISLTLLIATFGVFELTDVGSDSFDVVPLERSVSGLPIAEAPFSKERFAHPDRDGELSRKDLEELRSVYEQRAAGQVEWRSVMGWTVRGRTSFIANWEAIVDGESVRYSSGVGDIDRDQGLELLAFSKQYENEFHERIASGEAKELDRQVAVVENVEILFRRWSYSFPEWGEVVYWEGRVEE